jgi:hypothetical protein
VGSWSFGGARWTAETVEGLCGQLELWRGEVGSWSCGGARWAAGTVEGLAAGAVEELGGEAGTVEV